MVFLNHSLGPPRQMSCAVCFRSPFFPSFLHSFIPSHSFYFSPSSSSVSFYSASFNLLFSFLPLIHVNPSHSPAIHSPFGVQVQMKIRCRSTMIALHCGHRSRSLAQPTHVHACQHVKNATSTGWSIQMTRCVCVCVCVCTEG